MKTIQLSGVKRTNFGKKETKAYRREQLVPCVIYGGEKGEVHFAVDQKTLKPLLYTPYSHLVEINIEGEQELGVLREAQFHPVKEYPMHLDFFRVIEGRPVSIEVPVRVTGNAEGVKAGGKLSVAKRKLRISALSQYLPDEITIDITPLGIGQSFCCGDIQIENVKVLAPASTPICTILVTRASRTGEGEGEAAE